MPDLLVELRDRVLYLTLNRPDKLNAMSTEMMNGVLTELQKATHDTKVGAIVVTGAGRGFCSGGDITAMRARNESTGPAPTLEDRVANLRHGEEVSRLLHEMPKVTIAAVNGPAAGAGLSVAMACDIRIASDAARFG
ncbi:MAG TPA: enoyl-CoA hydratase/isomerase family protein, partial [Candidatus Binataceae bacterium]|nr:enoyl-CoA hydratase/isomerase family protein [Candidatus Binataceae bacterium]